MTRIIAGRWGGRRLEVPRQGVRPTSDRVRESVFNWLDHRIDDWGECRALDLFAGSGALGLEAVSRGATGAVLVERDRGALQVIRRNVDSLAAGGEVVVRSGSVRSVVAQQPVLCDIVFADPPYGIAEGEIARVLTDYAEHGWIRDGAWLIVETGSRAPEPWPPAMSGLQRRRYGDTVVWYGHSHIAVPGDEED